MKIMTIIILLIGNRTVGQTFSFNRDYLSEDTYCIKLKPRSAENSLDIESELERFDEKSIDKDINSEVFRIVSMGVPGNEKAIVINTLEKLDSTCILTIKIVKNLKKGEITVHTKTFDVEAWDKFNLLADTTFWNQKEEAPSIRAVHDGGIFIYEFNNLGRYYRVVRGSSTGDTEVGQTRKYLSYLLNYFFDVRCKTASR